MASKRLASVRGSFYPDKCNKLKIYFQKFTENLGTTLQDNHLYQNIPQAIIVPHAGYVYSGFTANIAYNILSHSNAKRIIVIGPSHHHYFKGISGSYYEEFETPCGDIVIDTDYLITLAKKHPISFEPKAHQQEHSTEVQMPFIQHYLPQAKVIELIYGDTSPLLLEKILLTLLSNKDNAIIISTDLSHFHTQHKAKQLDKYCLDAIKRVDIDQLKECEACGLLGVKTILNTAKQLGLRSKLLDYRTSADYSGDETQVVGYMSALFYSE
ncbi:MAG: AmmeMemoRadiSam system protein B [Campylobacterota bacterium]|nr:AmmeMemoRadiSam system protein B [Campylobacterota bacterium]